MSVDELWLRLAPRDDDDSATRLAEQVDWLEMQSKRLAHSHDARLAFVGRSTSVERQQLVQLSEVWTRAAQSTATSDVQEEKEEQIVEVDEVGEQRRLIVRKAVLFARVVRNVVVQNEYGQGVCFSVVPNILSALWHTTSFTLERHADVQLLSRTLVQLLSNLVTDNDKLQARLWTEHLNMGAEQSTWKGRSPSDLLCRLLDSNDTGTQVATQILLINTTVSSRERCVDIARTASGAAAMRSLLHSIHQSLEEDEEEEEAEEADRVVSDGDSGYGVPLQPSAVLLQRQQRRYEALGILYTFFINLFGQGLFDDAYASLAATMPHGSHIDISMISSSQITLLKLLDSYLHFATPPSTTTGDAYADLRGLVREFEALATWAERTMNATLQHSTTAPVDSRLVEVHVGLILMLQCLSNLAMATETARQGSERHSTGEAVLAQMRSDRFVEVLLALMRTTSAFSPPVSPFRPTKLATHASRPAPDGHVLSSTGKARIDDDLHGLSDGSRGNSQVRPRLDKLKRDLVGLLGIVAYQRGQHDRPTVRRVQDLVREKGGLLDVLNLTQLDERNPYIRERAIFALRNLLQANKESQDLVAQLKPVDPSGATTVDGN